MRWASLRSSACRRSDADSDGVHAIDAATNAITRLHWADAGGRTGENEIAGLEDIEPREIRDLFRNRPHQLPEIGVLTNLIVDLEPDASGLGMAHFAYWMNGADRCRCIECLAGLPRPASIARRELQITARHVETDRVAVYMVQRGGLRDVRARLADRHDELHFVSEVLARHRITERASVWHDRIGRLVEKERRLAVGVEAHLADMVGIVAAHAINAPYGEKRIRTADRHGGWRWQREYVGHKGSLLRLTAAKNK